MWRHISKLFIVPTCLKPQENDDGLCIRICDDCGKTDISYFVNLIKSNQQLKEDMCENNDSTNRENKKRYSHDAIVIVDHLKDDLIYIDGKDELLELAEYVDRLQEENEQLSDFKSKTFNSIDEKIERGKQAIEWGERVGADVGAMGFHIERLKMLKKELFE